MSQNLFTMLSAYRPNAPATPFENYCTSGLAYLLKQGHRMLTALISEVAGITGEPLAIVEVQPRIADAGIADLLLTFEGGRRVLIDVRVDMAGDDTILPALETAARAWVEPAAFVVLGLSEGPTPAGWRFVSWLRVVEALEDDPDPTAREYAEFVLRDILGIGEVPLEEAVTTNRLYALGGAAVRRHFGPAATHLNSCSRPTGGRYRYLGTTFSPDGGDMHYWVGIVNETVPLGDHYHLMLASKEAPLKEPASQPRATGDWKWAYWTGVGRVVRPISAPSYDELLGRIE
jgi:hypothetical protein